MPKREVFQPPPPSVKKKGAPPRKSPPKTKREATKRGKAAELTAADKIRGKAPDTSQHDIAAQVDADKPLTDMQKRFVKEWASGESVATATLRAGYESESVGYRMVKMPNVLAAYHLEKMKYEEAAQMTRKRVMDGFLEAIEMAKVMAEPMTMIAGWREVGKMCGYYEPTKHVVDVNVAGELTMRQMTEMSDAELMKILKTSLNQAADLAALGHEG